MSVFTPLQTSAGKLASLQIHWNQLVPLIAGIALIWLLLIYHLSSYWGTIEQYSYGWLVPPLILFAGYLRWRTRPPAGVPAKFAYVPLTIAALLLLPTWLLLQPSPEWRSITWMLALEAVVITLAVVALAGGRAWVSHFFWPCFLILTAVPWPRPLELPFTESLMRGVAKVTVELLNLSGINSVRQGSLIELSSGVLGVDEACSGIRSLQASVMAAFVLGELFRLSLIRRTVLVGSGVVIALGINVGRTYSLALSANNTGINAVDHWHDLAGITTLTLCFGAVWAVAKMLERGQSDPAIPAEAPRSRPVPSSLTWTLVIWIVLVLIGTELWFRGDDPPARSRWVVAAPEDRQVIPMKELFYTNLQYDRGEGAIWREPEGGEWYMYFFEWNPGPLRSRVMARLHRPENCLSAAGLNLIAERSPIQFAVAGEKLLFRSYTFEQGGRPLYVYHGTFESRGPRAMAIGTIPGASELPGLAAVMLRERNLGQQVAEFASGSFGTAEEADEAFREMLKHRIVPRSVSVN